MTSKKTFKTLFLLLTFAVVVSGCIGQGGTNEEFNDIVDSGVEFTKAEAIRDLLANKHDRDAENISLTISHETDNHVRGNVKFSEDPADAGMFLAAKVSGQWQLIFDGNGSFACAELEKYVFPEEMKVGCYVPAKYSKKEVKVSDLTWRTYNNEVLNYKVDYPTNVTVFTDDENLEIELIGDSFKVAVIHYYTPFYRPLEDTKVAEWVRIHPELEMGEEISIAGLPTVHFVQKKDSDQKVADYYYFIKDQRLYKIVIPYVSGREEVYSKFLESFSF